MLRVVVIDQLMPFLKFRQCDYEIPQGENIAGKALGVPMPVTKKTRKMVSKLIKAGDTDRDSGILFEQQAEASGIDLVPENIAVDDGLH